MSDFYCHVCRSGVKEGSRVASDPVLSAAIWAKKSLGISRSAGKVLVVCPKCMPAYAKKRDAFKNKAVFLGVVALVVMVVQAYYVDLAVGIIFAAFLLSLSIISYVPGLEREEPIPSKGA